MNQKRINGLDVVRTLAISLVLLLHMTEGVVGTPLVLQKIFSVGWVGVDIFFVLSGFLICSQVFKDQQDQSFKIQLSNFWIKRWFRTLPLYFVFLCVYMVIKPFFFAPFNDEKWKFFFFLQNFLSPRDFVQSWSLCIEEQFYLIFPLLIYGLKSLRKHIYLFVIPVLISIAMRWNIQDVFNVTTARNYAYYIMFPSYTHMDGICFGVILAFTQHHWIDYIRRYKNIFFGVGLFLLILVLFLTGKTPKGSMATWAFTYISLSASLLVMSGMFLNVNKKITPLFYWISTLSYSAYLWNNLFMRVVSKYCSHLHWLLSSIIFLSLTFLASYFTYIMIEKPFIKMRNRFLK